MKNADTWREIQGHGARKAPGLSLTLSERQDTVSTGCWPVAGDGPINRLTRASPHTQ
jgi:hypothetical protein